MRLEWLEDLLAVVETGSFREAAERRFLTQSAFSRRIQSIEDHIGAELFDRTRKPVQLRPAVAARHDQIQRLALEIGQLVRDLRSDARSLSGRIVLASQHSLTTTLMPSLLARIREGDRAIRVRLRSANLDECFGMLLSRQADIMIAYHASDEGFPAGLGETETIPIGTERLIPVLDAAGAEGLRTQSAPVEIPYVAYPIEVFFGAMMGRAILPAMRDAAVLVPVAETALSLAAVEMATIGMAVAWVPESLAAARLRDGSLSDLSDLLPSCPLDIVATRLPGTPSPLAAAVWSKIAP